MNRKDFIKTCGMFCIGGTALSVLLQNCVATNYFAQHQVSNTIITVKKTEFKKVEKDKVISRDYIIIKNEKLNFPICVYQLTPTTYSAVLMECTHNSCELKPNGHYLICPCHGSEFNNIGIVQNPPAEQNLKLFTITNDNENIYIQL